MQGILVGTIDQGIIYFIYLIDISFRGWILISGSVVERPPYQSLRLVAERLAFRRDLLLVVWACWRWIQRPEA